MAHKDKSKAESVRIRMLDDGSFVYSSTPKHGTGGEMPMMREKEYSTKDVSELVAWMKQDFSGTVKNKENSADAEYKKLTHGKNG